MPQLLLFDIDGTLLNSGATSFHRFIDNVADYLGKPIHYDGDHQMPGSTDPQIVKSFLLENGCDANDVDVAVEKVLSRFDSFYAAHEEQVAKEMVVLPGVPELLESLSKNTEFLLSLVTGNLRAVAQRKLRIANIDQYFNLDIAAFSDDSGIRTELPPIALKRSEEFVNHPFNETERWVIGDAKGDYDCAQTIQAKTLLVGTSGATVEELQALGATAVLPDLSNTAEVVRILSN